MTEKFDDNEWKLVTLDELGNLKTGKPAPKLSEKTKILFEGGTIPLIGCEEISKSILFIRNCNRFYNFFGLKIGKLFLKNTVCINQYGSGCGDSALLRNNSCLTNAVHGFNSFNKVSDCKFIKYYFDLPSFKKKIISLSNAVTAQPGLYLNKLLKTKILIPSFIIQQKIGDILSAYDELIENSEQQIEVFQNIRTSIFKEWFVNLRFPNNNGLSLDDLITVGGAEILKNWVILSQLKEEKFQLRILLRKEDIHFLPLQKIVQKESINILITCLQL
ncbi:restriction endonuclease subunit S [Mycoplasma parvum]|uniref:Type I restriction modification DNA specificity domain-containing protein n=1 Tax=Mycoplasma parvum str. Indiana TaxID=1403316 RepID=U5NFI2_9MOLU|nr:restriction endonuclease subunit S [Mycoplasma parvum]AGX88904.1 hypothetical protein PRV_00690 [Mycoplasma parvum str. Indiana]